MSDYTKSTNFATKDNLTPGDPLKIVRGTEIDTEFNNIATAIATKTDNASAAITGGSITGITDLAIADGGTGASTANAALNNLLPSQASASGKYLKSNGTDSSWDALDISTADITGTLPVANGGTGVTSSTGTGSVVLSNSPTLVTPALGTPASGVATNITGLPISTGVSGLGTGVATALAVNVGSTGAPLVNGGVLGTPSSGTATNLTGLPLTTGVTGTLPIANGGTGQTTANAAFNALAPSQATASGKYLKSDGTNTSWDALDISTADITGTLPVANGGTGVTTSTGTGSVVLSNSPTLVTPALGTPSSATLTNATGLPISTGVSGLGTGVATALAVNVGSAGAPVINGGALGTPSSGTVTNLTGTASININGTVGATTPTTGAFTTTTVSTSETLSYGTANGVTYLNGSKVLTSGSALTFDGTNLDLAYSSSTNKGRFASTSAGDFFIYGINGASIIYDADGDQHVWKNSSSEAMRLTSTGLGIGTSSPAGRIDSYGDGTNPAGIFRRGGAYGNIESTDASRTGKWTLGRDNAVTGNFVIALNNSTYASIDTSGNLGLGVTPSAWESILRAEQFGYSGSIVGGTAANNVSLNNNWYSTTAGVDTRINAGYATRYTQNASGQHGWYVSATSTAGSSISFTQAMTLDASGNLGVGTTSPTSASGYKFLTISDAGGANGAVFESISTGVTSRFFSRSSDGTSNIGTFSNHPLTFTTNSSERARIDSSGNFLVGVTSAFSSGKVCVQVANGSTTNGITIQDNASSGFGYIAFANGSGSTIGSITRITTTNAVAYNTTSDYRLKTVTGAVTGQGERIDALNPIDYQWKEGGQQARGFLAHEFQTVYPNSVTGEKDAVDADGNPVYQAMQASTAEVIADLVAEIKSLRQRVAQLETN